jgi:hypothetical protein
MEFGGLRAGTKLQKIGVDKNLISMKFKSAEEKGDNKEMTMLRSRNGKCGWYLGKERAIGKREPNQTKAKKCQLDHNKSK